MPVGVAEGDVVERRDEFMMRAIDLARRGMRAGDGGPFGAVIVREGQILGEGWNRVRSDADPTAHGEITAIRAACQRLENPHLEQADIYTTGEPCPMCLGAIHWARIDRIYYGFRIEDAERGGFDDLTLYHRMCRPAENGPIPASPLLAEEATKLIDEFLRLPGRARY
jgi:tRNA(Arg) A34 adenosine deaminase TadA